MIQVAQPFGGVAPAEMKRLMGSDYERRFVGTTGSEHLESKGILGTFSASTRG